MLASHSAIATSSEPWLLLPLLSATRTGGVFSAFGHDTAVRAIEDLWGELPNGRADYDQEVRRFVSRVYRKLSDPQAHYFLDKTPRYSLIADTVLDVFADNAAFVLWRHPLAVVASIVESWNDGRWAPYSMKVDLFDGLANLVDVYVRRRDRFVAVRYEDLVVDPESVAERLLDALGLDWEPRVVADFDRTTLVGSMGDKQGVRAYQAVSAAPLDKWKQTLTSPIRKAWCQRYLRWIGQERLAVMGYDLDEIQDELTAIPTRVGTSADDAMLLVKGSLWSVFEPRIARAKLSRRREFGRIYSHT